MFCNNCGQQIPDNAAFCPKCGHSISPSPAKTAPTPDPAPAPVYQQPAPTYQPQPAPVYQQPVYQAQPAAAVAVKPKKHKGLITLLVIIIVLLAGFIAVTFLVPGLVMPVNLGVKSSYEAYLSAMDKVGLSRDDTPESGAIEDYQVVYSGSHTVDETLTSEELTSYVNENRPPYFAVKNVQIRINDDGTVEASGTLNTAYVFDHVLGGEYSMEDAQRALPMLGLIPDNVNLYVKLSGSVVDNSVEDLDIESVSVMGITIPNDLIDSNEDFIVDTVDGLIARMNAKSGSNIEQLDFDNGKLNVKGTLPSYTERISVQ
ncbi:MAG TPA: zinc ribbon domain-containing protein [Oscillospiraceae bacterium]|nr:zinc ribbon domain-containing protein [Oscillospiraceae bacterium]HPF56057.1 zinc ribbon domain-containing protein [Clostridiales bacterium]HPK36147.1 zinc ribbon domain-containing protein [Oscillospiraceae bacterium]HPR75678.1 zinc ribbon domain-containing protein [Oscillospiraceae bacterium]